MSAPRKRVQDMAGAQHLNGPNFLDRAPRPVPRRVRSSLGRVARFVPVAGPFIGDFLDNRKTNKKYKQDVMRANDPTGYAKHRFRMGLVKKAGVGVLAGGVIAAGHSGLSLASGEMTASEQTDIQITEVTPTEELCYVNIGTKGRAGRHLKLLGPNNTDLDLRNYVKSVTPESMHGLVEQVVPNFGYDAQLTVKNLENTVKQCLLAEKMTIAYDPTIPFGASDTVESGKKPINVSIVGDKNSVVSYVAPIHTGKRKNSWQHDGVIAGAGEIFKSFFESERYRTALKNTGITDDDLDNANLFQGLEDMLENDVEAEIDNKSIECAAQLDTKPILEKVLKQLLFTILTPIYPKITKNDIAIDLSNLDLSTSSAKNAIRTEQDNTANKNAYQSAISGDYEIATGIPIVGNIKVNFKDDTTEPAPYTCTANELALAGLALANKGER